MGDLPLYKVEVSQTCFPAAQLGDFNSNGWDKARLFHCCFLKPMVRERPFDRFGGWPSRLSRVAWSEPLKVT
jgi:hypothetical protein